MKNWILYEDNHIIIVNKPPRIPVQGDKTGDITLLDVGKQYIKKEYNKPGNVFLGLPHRLDRPTSGIVILSKTSKSLSRITELFREKKIKKTYWAVVKEKLKKDNGTLINFLKKNKTLNKSFVSKNEKNGFLKSELNYQLLKKLDNYFLYEINLITGRHPNRPAHLHYIVSAPGYKPVVTHVFVKGSEYLDSDAVFGVKDSLISEYKFVDDIERAKDVGFNTTFYELEFNFVLEKP